MKVKDIMSNELVYLSPDRNFDCLDEVMKWHHIRHVLVLTPEHHLAGVVSNSDLLAAVLENIHFTNQKKLIRNIRVADIMKTKIETIHYKDNLSDAAWTMIENGVSCLPVLDDDEEVIGMLTEADFVKVYAQRC